MLPTTAPTPTPAASPAISPMSTPVASPERVAGAVPKAKKKTKKIKKPNPEILLLAPNNMKYPEDTTDRDILEELKLGRYLKYIYQNSIYNKTTVKNLIFEGKIDLEVDKIRYLNIEKFKHIVNGSYTRLEEKK